MPNAQDPLPNLRIAAPCTASWDSMAGDNRVRHCTLCSLNVYNFAEMTRDELRELLARTEGHERGLLRLRDELGPIFRDQDFAVLYPRRGQPALPPWRLALASVQFNVPGA